MDKTKNISAKRVVVTSFLIDISDIVINLIVAVLSGSVAILSQFLRGLADLLTSGLLIVGINRSGRKASHSFQFGYGRELFFWVLLASVSMLVITGGMSLYFGAQRIIKPELITNLPLMYGSLLIGLITNSYGAFLSIRRIKQHLPKVSFWRKIFYYGQVETKATFALDSMGAAASLFGLGSTIFYQITGDGRFDGAGAVLMGLIIAVLAGFLFKDAKGLLVGRSANPETEQLIKKSALAIEGVTGVMDLHTMYMGSAKLLVNIEVSLESDLRTRQIELIMDAIKKQIMNQVPAVEHIQVELETP